MGNNGNVKTTSAGECACLCKKVCNCGVFHWNAIDQRCWLKTVDAIKNRISGPAHEISGIMSDCNGPIEPECIKKEDIATYHQSNPAEKACVPEACHMKGVDFLYGDINDGNIKTNSAGECACLCKQACGCEVFYWNGADQRCWLKTADALKNRRSRPANEIAGIMDVCTSGVSSCIQPDDIATYHQSNPVEQICVPETCHIVGADFLYGDINNGNVKTSSARECACLCKQACGCEVFYWNGGDQRCWLKTSEALKNKMSRPANEIAGIMNKCNGTEQNQCIDKENIIMYQQSNPSKDDCVPESCHLKGTNFPFGDINNGNVKTTSAGECACLCKKVCNCGVFHWNAI